DRRQRADLGHVAARLVDEPADVVQRLAGGQAQTLVGGAVAHADTEAEASPRQLVDRRRRLRVLEGVARIDVGDAGPERDLAGGHRERLAEPEPVAGTRTVDPREALALEALGQLQRRPPPP